MRRFLSIGLLLLAVAVGIFLPKGYMLILDETLSEPETISTSEPVLKADMELTGEVEKILESRSVARRLMEFRDGAVVWLADRMESEEAVDAATGEEAVEIAIVLLDDIVEESLVLHQIIKEDMLALLSDNVVIRVWNVEIRFNSGWIANMIIDVDNGAVLQMRIQNGDGMALWRLFQEADDNMTKAELVEYITQRTAESLSNYMGSNPMGRVEVEPGREEAMVTFDGHPPTTVDVPFVTEFYRGIYFNVGSES